MGGLPVVVAAAAGAVSITCAANGSERQTEQIRVCRRRGCAAGVDNI